MNAKLCDPCLLEGKLTLLGTDFRYWHWSHSRARTIHLCAKHHDLAKTVLKAQTYEDYVKYVNDIDHAAMKLGVFY